MIEKYIPNPEVTGSSPVGVTISKKIPIKINKLITKVSRVFLGVVHFTSLFYLKY